MKPTTYSSKVGAILTMIGVAVGLGNVWRFPYMMGSYGGSAFLLVYLAFTILFAYPALVNEISVGKKNPGGTIAAFKNIFPHPIGIIIGSLLVFVVTVAGSYYAVVVANVWYTAFFSITQGFGTETMANFQSQLNSGPIQYGVTVGLIVLSLVISYLGLRRGIERISTLIMPFFVLAILYMIGHAWILPGAIDNVINFLKPDFSQMGPPEIFAALGQAFFSLGLGGTFVIVYSGYLKDDKQVSTIAKYTSLGDVGSSVLVSLFLVPTILVFGVQMDSGPSLIFNTLPQLFSDIPAGRWIGSLFLVSLGLVALLSLIAAFQVPLSSLNLKISKPQLYFGFALIQIIFSIPSAFNPEIIGILDLIFGSGMQVIGSLLAVLGVWWGSQRSSYLQSLLPNSSESTKQTVKWWFRWAIPTILFVILIWYLVENLF